MKSVQEIKRTDGIIERLRIAGAQVGPLEGKTFVVKDLFDVKGRITGGGNPDWKRLHQPAVESADIVDVLLSAGATLEGVSCSDEFAFSIDGINIHYGAPVNPQFKDRVSGGSSSGSVSAVAAGLVDFSIGTDTAGSVRVPASYCGIYGIRPTQGAISLRGVMPLSETFDTPGWFARDGAMMRVVGEVLLGSSQSGILVSKNRFQKLLIAPEAFALLDPDIAKDLEYAVEKLRALFDKSDTVPLSGMHWETFPEHLNRVRAWECTQYYGKWLHENQPKMADDISSRFSAARKITKEQHDTSLAFANDLTVQFDKLLGDTSVLCIPTVCSLPPRVNSTSDELQQNRGSNLRLTALTSVARLPQISIPVSLQMGCKFGLSLIANRNMDLNLLKFCEDLRLDK